jgi:hypothetical protein
MSFTKREPLDPSGLRLTADADAVIEAEKITARSITATSLTVDKIDLPVLGVDAHYNEPHQHEEWGFILPSGVTFWGSYWNGIHLHLDEERGRAEFRLRYEEKVAELSLGADHYTVVFVKRIRLVNFTVPTVVI